MGFFQLFAMGAGLSMDAFAVAVGRGLGMKKINGWQTFVIALFFGGFQALMPTVGWFLGERFLYLIEPVDHWIAFGLLALIGGKMIVDSRRATTEKDGEQPFRYRQLLIMALATSIDALAAGLSLGVLGGGILLPAVIIGCTTFTFCIGGVLIGHYVGGRFQRIAETAGGAVLILIGAEILIQHMAPSVLT